MKNVILLIIMSNYSQWNVQVFDDMEKCLDQSKLEIAKPWAVIDPGFYNPRVITNIAFCVQGSVIQSANTR